MGTEQYLLDRFGISMEDARTYLMKNYLNNLSEIYTICLQNNVTNDMIADILAPSFPSLTGETVSSFFTYYGFDGESLGYNVQIDTSLFSNRNDTLGTVASLGSSGVAELDSDIHWDSSKTIIYYSFNESIPDSYYDVWYLNQGFTTLDHFQQEAIRSIMGQVDDLLGISLEESSGDGDIRFSMVNQNDSAAFAFFPGTVPDYLGDVFLSTDFNLPSSANGYSMIPGSYGWNTIVHELGHTLGLEHPFAYPIDQAGEPPHLSTQYDNGLYTIMSYTEIYNYTPVFSLVNNTIKVEYEGVYPMLYSIYDLNALQALYGVNTTTNSDDNTYSFSYTDYTYEVIWDTGGTDTFDLSSNLGDTTLDLNGGSLNSIDQYNTDEIISYFQNEVNDSYFNSWIADVINDLYQNDELYTGFHNIGIGTGVIIENVITGSGDDTITDNEVDNLITTGFGNDTIHVGNGGYDIVDGGGGTDRLSISYLQDELEFANTGNSYYLYNESYGVEFENIETIEFQDSSIVSITQLLG